MGAGNGPDGSDRRPEPGPVSRSDGAPKSTSGCAVDGPSRSDAADPSTCLAKKAKRSSLVMGHAGRPSIRTVPSGVDALEPDSACRNGASKKLACPLPLIVTP